MEIDYTLAANRSDRRLVQLAEIKDIVNKGIAATVGDLATAFCRAQALEPKLKALDEEGVTLMGMTNYTALRRLCAKLLALQNDLMTSTGRPDWSVLVKLTDTGED